MEEPTAYTIATQFNLFPAYSSNPNDFEIKRVYVRRDYKGKQIGRQLISEIITWFKPVDPRPGRILLEVYYKNTNAIHSYEKYGFKQVDDHSSNLGETTFKIFSFDFVNRVGN
ncbi:unnamed protein product [Adineta steineri]|uniref:N-acetyltransferase domain-containing protein n=1 Tax=Adineta steineri TaxID=433720 RepID=A0A818N8N5_9BILA|nr:unnamed protein product [Adineta steineri]CAF3602399.1 unnamed protein product [Adineta steineri]